MKRFAFDVDEQNPPTLNKYHVRLLRIDKLFLSYIQQINDYIKRSIIHAMCAIHS